MANEHDQSMLAELEPGLRRLRARNPSPMTFTGTNTYLIGQTEVAVIDPGPDDPEHLKQILSAVPRHGRVSHIFVTHSHRDHSPLARRLSDVTQAPILAFGTHLEGRRPIMQSLADSGLSDGGEGIDTGFTPDRRLADGETVQGEGWALTALWTPGHISNHLCFAWGDRLFSGDHVMGWASSLVSPPDGDLTAFMASCRALKSLDHRAYFPGHGDPVTSPKARLEWLIAHREAREAAIIAALASGETNLADLTAVVYADTPKQMWPAAARNLFAHLIALVERGAIEATPKLSTSARFTLI